MTIDDIKNLLMEKLSPKRYKHSLNVMDTAGKLADTYGLDVAKASLAGLIHDCAREIRGNDVFLECNRFNIEISNVCKIQPELLHGPLGAKLAEEQYGITDEIILNAVRWHTTGHENMDLMAKVIYIADYIEPGRSFPGIEEARQLAFKNIDSAMVFSLDRTIRFVVSRGLLVHPDTINARNSILIKTIEKRN